MVFTKKDNKLLCLCGRGCVPSCTLAVALQPCSPGVHLYLLHISSSDFVLLPLILSLNRAVSSVLKTHYPASIERTVAHSQLAVLAVKPKAYAAFLLESPSVQQLGVAMGGVADG